MSEPCRVITEEQYKDYLRSKEQLNKANEVIKGYSKLESLMNCALGKCEKSPAQDYLKKWSVK